MLQTLGNYIAKVEELGENDPLYLVTLFSKSEVNLPTDNSCMIFPNEPYGKVRELLQSVGMAQVGEYDRGFPLFAKMRKTEEFTQEGTGLKTALLVPHKTITAYLQVGEFGRFTRFFIHEDTNDLYRKVAEVNLEVGLRTVSGRIRPSKSDVSDFERLLTTYSLDELRETEIDEGLSLADQLSFVKKDYISEWCFNKAMFEFLKQIRNSGLNVFFDISKATGRTRGLAVQGDYGIPDEFLQK